MSSRTIVHAKPGVLEMLVPEVRGDRIYSALRIYDSSENNSEQIKQKIPLITAVDVLFSIKPVQLSERYNI